MDVAGLQQAIAAVPAGRWGVAVSGGADSVALLRLLLGRPELTLVVIHLDHETRNGQSAEDAAFVEQLAQSHRLPVVLARRSMIEPQLADPPRNRSALFRACRHEVFRRAVAEHDLQGVLLAHHADDQAETVLHRLLRGSGPAGLAGMGEAATIRGVSIRRPLLNVPKQVLCAYLKSIGQAWREDESNRSPAYARNRLRGLLQRRPELIDALLEMGRAMGALRQWLQSAAPQLPGDLAAGDLDGLPSIIQRQMLRNWLAAAGSPAGEIDPATIDRLDAMLHDAATPRRAHFPGRVLVTRRQGKLSTR